MYIQSKRRATAYLQTQCLVVSDDVVEPAHYNL